MNKKIVVADNTYKPRPWEIDNYTCNPLIKEDVHMYYHCNKEWLSMEYSDPRSCEGISKQRRGNVYIVCNKVKKEKTHPDFPKW